MRQLVSEMVRRGGGIGSWEGGQGSTGAGEQGSRACPFVIIGTHL